MNKPRKPPLPRAITEFLKGAVRHIGEDQADLTGRPNCMYWLKHHEAALLINALMTNSRRADLTPTIQGWYRSVAVKIAQQWNQYEKTEQTLQAKGPPQ